MLGDYLTMPGAEEKDKIKATLPNLASYKAIQFTSFHWPSFWKKCIIKFLRPGIWKCCLLYSYDCNFWSPSVLHAGGPVLDNWEYRHWDEGHPWIQKKRGLRVMTIWLLLDFSTRLNLPICWPQVGFMSAIPGCPMSDLVQPCCALARDWDYWASFQEKTHQISIRLGKPISMYLSIYLSIYLSVYLCIKILPYIAGALVFAIILTSDLKMCFLGPHKEFQVTF